MKRFKFLSLLLCMLLYWVAIGQAAIVKGKALNDKDQPIDEVEIFLVSEGLNYAEYQYVTGGRFVFLDVPIGQYVLYIRATNPPGDKDRPDIKWSVEIKEEQQVYEIHLGLNRPSKFMPPVVPEKHKGAGTR